MNRKQTLLALLLGLAVLGAAAFAVWRNQPHWTLTVGIDPTFSPFASKNADDGYSGFDIDLARSLAKALRCQVEFKEIPFRELLTNLQSGQVQLVISAMAVRTDHQAWADFTRPYYDATQVVVMLAQDERQPGCPEDLAAWRLGVQAGTTGAFEALALKGEEDDSLRQMNSPTELVNALLAAEVDALLLDRQLADRCLRLHPELRLVAVGFWEEQYAVAVQKGQTELLDLVDAALAAWLQSPEYERTLVRWFGLE